MRLGRMTRASYAATAPLHGCRHRWIGTMPARRRSLARIDQRPTMYESWIVGTAMATTKSVVTAKASPTNVR